MKRVLSGKKLSEATIAYAHSLDLDVQCMNFIEIEPITLDLGELVNDTFDSIVFTSSNAVNFFVMNPYCKELLKTKNIFSISGKTTNSLLKADVQPKLLASNAATLAGKIIESKLKSVLHPCGNLTLDTLGSKLKDTTIKYHALLVYQTILNKEIKLNKTYDVIMFFSPSGIESFFNVNKWDSNSIACCIGETTSEVFQKKQPNAKIITSTLPIPEEMLKTISNYFQKHKAEA